MEERAVLKLLGTKESLFTQRIVWALELKGISYEFIEQDFSTRSSPLLLELNPVYKKVPVLVHNGKPLCESLVILEYIEETWPSSCLLPIDPFDRASARFWAKFIDGKFYEAARKAFFSCGETKTEGVESVAEGLQILEGQIIGKKFFGGETIGYVDIVVGWIAYWLQYIEEVGEFKAMDSRKYPALHAWINNFIQVPIIQQSLPKPDAVKTVYKRFKEAALAGIPKYAIPVYKEDIDLMQFSENVEFLEAEYFLWATHGYGLDVVAPELVMGGPPPIGVHKANLDPFTKNIITEFAMQEVAHLSALKSKVGGFPRPLMDLSAKHFANLFDEAFGYKLEPPFDPYRDSLSFMLSCYALPYTALVGYVGTNSLIRGYQSKRLLAGLLGVESGQDAIIRMYLYERATRVVYPYKHTVAEFTIHISTLRNRLAMCGIKDEGLFVPWQLGAENRTTTNILAADYNSLTQWRTPTETLRIVYNTGNEHVPGGFFPHGANGNIARRLLKLE